jgi:2-polyprenyl-6-methoxyphenol hydroxylase-like FAD-dependent oxidoreductase
MARLRVRIAGGSLAGLFVATLLKREGHDVRIYERSVGGLDGRGAGLLGKKETFAILRAAGCEHVARVGVVARERVTFNETGAVVDRSMAPQSQLSWDYLYRTFRAFIADDDYVLGRHVDGVRQDDHAAYLSFKDGEEEPADIVIGADGTASVVRNAVNSRPSPSIYAGYVGWRGLLPETALPPQAAADLLDRFAFHQLSGSHVLGFLVAGPHAETIPGSRRYNWVWYRPAAGEKARAAVFTDSAGRVHPYSLPPGSVPRAARAVTIADAARLLPTSLAAAVAATEQPFVQGVFDYETPLMANGRMVLIGDAAFVARPHTAMGVAKAAGDAMALVAHLSRKPVVEALRAFHEERLPVGASIVAYGRRLGEMLTAKASTET